MTRLARLSFSKPWESTPARGRESKKIFSFMAFDLQGLGLRGTMRPSDKSLVLLIEEAMAFSEVRL